MRLLHRIIHGRARQEHAHLPGLGLVLVTRCRCGALWVETNGLERLGRGNVRVNRTLEAGR